MIVELMPRIGAPKPLLGILGSGFTLCIVNAGERLRAFLVSPVSAEILSKFYGVRRSSYEELLGVFDGMVWAGEARLKREFDFYYTDIFVSDVPGLVNSLGGREVVCISVSRDPGLRMVFASKAASLLSKASKYNNESFELQGREATEEDVQGGPGENPF